MFPYLIAGAIGYAVAKIFEDDKTPKYADGGSVLLAPNGKPSNLTPEQYKLVRTTAFKQWFGDWENSPETSSKVVDENGEPLVCYHTTDYLGDINIFKFSEEYNFQQYGYGVYFTDDKKHSEDYFEGENYKVYEVFLNLKNPIIRNEKEKGNTKKYFLINREENNKAGAIIYHPDRRKWNYFIAGEPEQIKLADGTNTTFDGSNPDIRFEEGGLVQLYQSNPEIVIKKNSIIGTTDINYDLFGTKAHVQFFGEPMGIEGIPSWAKKEFYIENIYRDNEKGIRGSGLILLKKIIEHAKRNSVDIITLKRAEYSGEKLRNYYTRIGFVDVGEKEPLGMYLDLRINEPLEKIDNIIKEQIKLANGTNTKFDNNNPDIRYAGGGELKKTYQDLIEGYELSLEIETNKQKIKMYRDLIDGYKLALELEEDAQPKKQKVSAQPKKQKISAENKAIIKQLIKSIPKSTYQEYGDGGLPYELLVYANDDEFEVSEFVSFKNITELDKVIDKIITKHKNKLLRIEFRWSQYYGYPDSIVIYNAQELEGEEIQEEIKEEIQEEPIKEVEQIQEVVIQEVVQDDFQPNYLMTLDEYQEKVTPLIQAYKKFLRKNKDWFVKPNYSGIAHYSLEEALEQIDDEDSAFAPTTKYSSYKNKKEKEKAIRENYSYEKTRKHDDKYTQEPTPPNLITENKEYIEKLKKYFSTYDLNSRVDGDETKSNKRAVRRAIDNNTYKELLTNKKVQLIELQKVSDSVGIRLPKSIFDKSTQNQMKYESELGKLLSNIPILSYQKLKELIEQIKVDLIPLEELVYEQEYARYSKMINENIGQTKKEESFDVVIPFWDEVYNTESEYKKEPSSRRDYTGNPYMESVNYIKLNSLKSNWEKNLSSWLKEYVANLKMAIIIAIMRNFQSINMPIKSIERLSIKVGKKGFEGSYKFTFENGSSFIMNFQGIGAGGYNIQSYHFRYLTNFSDVKLTDGSIGGTNYYQIINNFSFKK